MDESTRTAGDVVLRHSFRSSPGAREISARRLTELVVGDEASRIYDARPMRVSNRNWISPVFNVLRGDRKEKGDLGTKQSDFRWDVRFMMSFTGAP